MLEHLRLTAFICHCEQRSDAAIPIQLCAHNPDGDCFVAALLAMTTGWRTPVSPIKVWRLSPDTGALAA
jgi:hypothetical protein